MSRTVPPDSQEMAYRINMNVGLLQELQDGPKQKAELAEALDVSKSTVYHGYEDPNGHDLLERGSDGYRLTTVGRYIAETYVEMLVTITDIHCTRSLLEEMPPDVAPPRDVLEAASTELHDGHPEQVQTTFCEWISTTDEVRGVIPHVRCAFVECVSETLLTDGLTMELTLTPEAMEYLEGHHPEDLRTVLESDSTVVIEATDLPSFGLVVVDEPRREAGLVSYTDEGAISRFIRFPTESAYRWADEQISKYTDELQSQSTPTRVITD